MRRALTTLIFLVAAAPLGGRSSASPCSEWKLDGYFVGMPGDALLAVRSVTLHVQGQAQVVQTGQFRGVLVLDDVGRLEKWDVVYDATTADELRSDLARRFGAPVSDVTGTALQTETSTVRQRRTIWRDTACDVAIVLYENTADGSMTGGSVRASLARASSLPKGLVEARSLYP